MSKIITFLAFLITHSNSFAFTDYLVKTKEDLSLRQMSALNLSPVREKIFVVSPEHLSQMRQQVEIIDINPNHIIKLDRFPNDLTRDQWGFYNASTGMDAKITEAWKKSTGTKKIVVAVTDTGIDLSHPDLSDNIWVNQIEAQGQSGVDDDGNGFVDDFHGWNFAYNTNNVNDVKTHGTHVAGVIGASGDNGVGIAGINWQVSLMSVPFFFKNQETTMANAIRSIDYAVTNGAHIINASWGASYDPKGVEEFSLLSEAIERAANQGVLFVAAAGNSRHNNDKKGHVPASLNNRNIISVGSMTRSGRSSSFSNYGQRSVDVFAPGSTIKSTLPGGSYGNMSGTSMAAPFVSGIAALMLSKKPGLSPEAIIEKLVSSCDPNPYLTKKCQCQGHVNADKAID